MVSYQEGSVVSRIIQQTPSGTFTIFSFDAGQELSEHTSPFNAYINVLDGEGEIILDGVTQTVKTGEIILMPGGIPHAVKAVTPFKMLLTLFKSADQ
jgi:quercetin dioxygenase-like cupin family protein